MIIYSATKERFQKDVFTNDIGGIIYRAFQLVTNKKVGSSEINSWTNSLQYVDRLLSDENIPKDSGVAIEYHLPQSSKRIDFLLTGENEDHNELIILIELKQWTKAELTNKDAIVITKFSRGDCETTHPSYQVWSYKRLLEDFSLTVQQDNIHIFPCAYLHNYIDDGIISHTFYADHIAKAPIFFKNDANILRDFISKKIKYGDTKHTIHRIDKGKIQPSKNLADQLHSLISGNEEFVLIDDQKVAFETALNLVKNLNTKKKHVLIVEGGPGTGKSVVAINLLVALTYMSFNARYVTRNSAPRLVYEAKLTGSMKKTHISNMFSSSGSFHSTKKNIFDCLIIDEAHRLNERSGMFNHLGENQIKEIINASKVSIFFIDEDQKVTIKDIGDKEQIEKWASYHKCDISEIKLESQFRCNGSDGYLSWLDNVLQIKNTANEKLAPEDYDFKIINDPSTLHQLIKEKNKNNNKSRVVAGYCWNWISKKNPLLKDIIIGDYKATWNLETDGQAWIIQPESVDEIGCIHTCQGLEVDYIGVIVGLDLIVRNGKVLTQPQERAKTDKSIHGWKSLFKNDPNLTMDRLDGIIKNTYRTLMTRGQKGCYVFFVDDETKRHFSNYLTT